MSERTSHAWLYKLKPFEKASWSAVIVQLTNTLLPYVGLYILAVWLVRGGAPWYLLLPVNLFLGLLVVRMFIFFHDCTHGSFTPSQRANRIIGNILGILAFTPFQAWRRSHGIHHASTGQLDHRGVGDVWTMTLEEYRLASPVLRAWYRLYRHPLFLFLIVPWFLFIVLHRFPGKSARAPERRAVLLTNLAMLLFYGMLGAVLGWEILVLVQLPVIVTAAMAGVWLFYVQHQFDATYWARDKDWNQVDACLKGSSHYRLGPVLQWFSGNIGLHHIHHLKPRIPNYRLQDCQDAIKELQTGSTLTIRRSLGSLFTHVWDEANSRLLSFRAARKML